MESLELFLRSWWSKTYNRPLKDPILESYHVYELMYEYFDKIERENAVKLIAERENDRIVDEKVQETLDWIEQEERKEAEAKKANKADSEAEDEGWMIEQLKKQYGENFGDDINLDL